MSLQPQDRLGPYEILAAIGSHGMGEVYKARDTRLNRTVAVKVSAERFSERFEQEARAIAALNHPNICHLYDVGPNYLVMELIEGAALKGPLAVDKAIAYAGQILDALDAAHCKGITHRDLKPPNILVTKQGIKLLDFGLAKQTAPLKETDVTNALTQQGQIVGTLQYMSPEQLHGIRTLLHEPLHGSCEILCCKGSDCPIDLLAPLRSLQCRRSPGVHAHHQKPQVRQCAMKQHILGAPAGAPFLQDRLGPRLAINKDDEWILFRRIEALRPHHPAIEFHAGLGLHVKEFGSGL
jgi:serine/threonine protein kinase